MQTYPQINYMPIRLWDGRYVPPLQMVQETYTYIPDGFETETEPAPAPVVAPRVKDPRNGFLRQVSLLLVFGMLCLGAYYLSAAMS